jgi:hypothetical protein
MMKLALAEMEKHQPLAALKEIIRQPLKTGVSKLVFDFCSS